MAHEHRERLFTCLYSWALLGPQRLFISCPEKQQILPLAKCARSKPCVCLCVCVCVCVCVCARVRARVCVHAYWLVTFLSRGKIRVLSCFLSTQWASVFTDLVFHYSFLSHHRFFPPVSRHLQIISRPPLIWPSRHTPHTSNPPSLQAS